MNSHIHKSKRALLSVSDKSGIEELASSLVEIGWEILSTGGTARVLRDAGVQVTEVSQITDRVCEEIQGRWPASAVICHFLGERFFESAF